jgi:flagellar hook-associated protein 1 FlgK
MADLLSTGISGVRTYQRALATVGNNIANVDTDGFSRQRVEIAENVSSSEGSLNIGNGARAVRVQRSYDNFVESNLRSGQAQLSKHESALEYVTQLENIVADKQLSLSTSLNEFFAAVQEVSVSPSSVAARQNLLNVAETTVSQFGSIGMQLQRIEEDSYVDLGVKANEITQYAQQLATINSALSRTVSLDKQPNELLDRRDILIQDMSKLLRVSVVEAANGVIDVHIGDVASGQYLVRGDVGSTLGLQRSINNSDEVSLVLDSHMSPQTVTQLVGGSIVGIMEFRQGALTTLRDELDTVAQVFVVEVNEVHSLGINAHGEFGDELFSLGDIYNVNPSLNNQGTGVVNLSPLADVAIERLSMSLTYSGTDSQWTLTNLATQDSVSGNTELTLGGIKVALTGVPVDGDTFTLEPNKRSIDALQIAVTDHSNLAAGGAVSVARSSSNTSATNMVLNGYSRPAGSTGEDTREKLLQNINVVFSSASNYTLVDVATGTDIASGVLSAGGSIQHNGWEVSFDSVVQANDTYAVRGNEYLAGDNRNLLQMIELQGDKTLFNGRGDFTEVYTDIIGDVGNALVQASVSRDAQQIIVDQAQQKSDETSAVSLDEEAANLLRFQQAYQASAQIISTASKLFDTILGIR